MEKKRKQIRLRHFDYGNTGAYYVTICTSERKRFLSKIDGENITLTKFGIVAQEELDRTIEMRPNISLGEYGFNSGDKHPKFDRVRFDNNDPNGAFVYDYFPATILIYAEDTGVEIEAEKIQRRGFGKLAAIADQVVYLPQDELRAEVEMPVIEEDEYGRTEFQSVMEETEEQEVDTNEELVLSANDPRIGTEDEPGIDDEEYTRRFLARVKPIAQKEWEERMRNEKLKAETEPAVAESQPVTSIEELRSTPDELARMPIHMNSYSPDKTPAPGSKPIRPSANMPKRQTQNVHSDVIEK